MTARYYDTESDTVLTWDELYSIWQAEVNEAEHSDIMNFGDFSDEFRTTFGEYLNNCCAKNGTLVPISDELTGKLYYDFEHGDIVDRKTAYYRLEREYGFDDFTPMSEMWEYFREVK